MHPRQFSSLFRTSTFALLLTFPLLTQAQTSTPASPVPTGTATMTPASPAPAPAAPMATPAETAPAPAAATDTAERPTTYTMQTGDTLDSIAKKFDTSIHALAKLNKITKAQYRKLRAGKVLQIPPATSDTPAAK